MQTKHNLIIFFISIVILSLALVVMNKKLTSPPPQEILTTLEQSGYLKVVISKTAYGKGYCFSGARYVYFFEAQKAKKSVKGIICENPIGEPEIREGITGRYQFENK
jgi:hypothetical protein